MFLRRRSHKVDQLKKVPLLSDLSQRQLSLVAALAAERKRDAGKVLARQGTPGLEFFLLLEGTARVERDGKLIARLNIGDCFGEMSLIDYQARSASVIAETPVVLLVIHTHAFPPAPGLGPGAAEEAAGRPLSAFASGRRCARGSELAPPERSVPLRSFGPPESQLGDRADGPVRLHRCAVRQTLARHVYPDAKHS